MLQSHDGIVPIPVEMRTVEPLWLGQILRHHT
jgi:hypothetical protein